MPAQLTLGFIGAGKMATALATGCIHAGLATADRVIASDPSDAARAKFAEIDPDQVAGADLECRYQVRHGLRQRTIDTPFQMTRSIFHINAFVQQMVSCIFCQHEDERRRRRLKNSLLENT